MGLPGTVKAKVRAADASAPLGAEANSSSRRRDSRNRREHTQHKKGGAVSRVSFEGHGHLRWEGLREAASSVVRFRILRIGRRAIKALRSALLQSLLIRGVAGGRGGS